MSLPVFPVQTNNGVRMGAMALAASAAPTARQLELADLPRAPQPTSHSPR